MGRLLRLYPYLGPLIFGPLALLAWMRHWPQAPALVAVALVVPVVHAYVVPAIGTNVLGMWAFTTKVRIGRFRPHHGFVFGTATALLTLPLVGPADPAPSLGTILSTGLVVGMVLFLVNWAYDALALRHGILEVYNQPWSDGAGPWAIAADYSPWFFGLFGVIYGAGLKVAEGRLLDHPDLATAVALGCILVAATSLLPTFGYMVASRLRHGHWGLRPCPSPRVAVGPGLPSSSEILP